MRISLFTVSVSPSRSLVIRCRLCKNDDALEKIKKSPTIITIASIFILGSFFNDEKSPRLTVRLEYSFLKKNNIVLHVILDSCLLRSFF